MTSPFSFKRAALTHSRAFEHAEESMPAEKRIAYAGWTALHSEYKPAFGVRIEAAIKWTEQHPDKFIAMIKDFDTALDFLNDTDKTVDEKTFPNITAYAKHRKGSLPRLGGQDTHNGTQIHAAAIDSGHKLRWGETIKPKDGDYYGFHTFVQSDEGMVAASLTDLYENYTRELGLYPDIANIDAIVANAITEAVYLTNPDGELFQIYKNPTDEWIYGYDGFSSEFQQIVYPESSAQS